MKVDVNSIINSLLIKYPLFGSIIANTKFVKDSKTQTASTDGDNIFYNEEFLKNLNEEEQIFAFAHEICHIAFDHIYRSEGKNINIWNTATDSVINALLKEDGLTPFKGIIDNPEAINYNADEMYEKLLKEAKQNTNNDNKSNKQNKDDNSQNSSNKKDENTKENKSDSNDNSANKGHDDHSLWEKAIEKKNKKDNNPKENTTKEEHIKKISKAGEQKTFKKNKQARNKQLEEMIDSLTEGSIGIGNTTSSLERLINNIGESKPLIDWRKALKESLKFDVDWSYSNATIEEGVVTPHLEERPCPVTEIVLDTSGSISETLLRNFLRECKNIIKTSKVKVGCFDTKFYGFTEIKSIKDIDNLKFIGGGGTNFNVAVNAFTRRVENKIIFTDGKASMPSKKIDAIWVVFGGYKIKPNGGKVIYITDEQLKVLNTVRNNKTR